MTVKKKNEEVVLKEESIKIINEIGEKDAEKEII